jgi:DNA-binding HxlR family transcriptional regulator
MSAADDEGVGHGNRSWVGGHQLVRRLMGRRDGQPVGFHNQVTFYNLVVEWSWARTLGFVTEARPPLQSCSYTEEVFGVLGKRWMGVLIDLLLQRPSRFNELHAALPALSKRVLSERLGELQNIGLVERDVDPGPPIAATYRLTERGRGLAPAMDALRVWAGAPVDDEGRPIPPGAGARQRTNTR